jgi:hypothetical protein
MPDLYYPDEILELIATASKTTPILLDRYQDAGTSVRILCSHGLTALAVSCRRSH